MNRAIRQDDGLSIGAVERRFADLHFPVGMSDYVGTDGFTQLPQRKFSDSASKNSWSLMRFRGLDGKIFKYEGVVDHQRIESTACSILNFYKRQP